MKKGRIERLLKYTYDLRDSFLKDSFKISFYKYQMDPSNAILKRVLLHKGGTIPIIFSRQSGKTTMIVYTVVFIAVFIFSLGKIFNFPFRTDMGKKVYTIIIFAPTIEQAKTDFDRIKHALNALRVKYVEEYCEESEWKLESEKSNANTLILENGVTIHAYSLSPTSHPESKTADLVIYEESQHILDYRMENVAQPMAVATNAPELLVGTAGYQRCRLYVEVQDADIKATEVYIADMEIVIAEKRIKFFEDSDRFHLNYEEKLKGEGGIIEKLGENSDTVKTQYRLVWVLGRGNFFDNVEILMSLQGAYDELKSYDDDTYLFIDWGKENSATVATFMDSRLRILSWLELHGTDYNVQWELIARKAQNYQIKKMGMDATGTQDQQLDWITQWIKKFNSKNEKKLPYPVGIDYTLTNKDIMYRKAWYLCHDTIVGDEITSHSQLRFPRTETPELRRFIWEWTWLQKEIKQGKYWSCHAPEGDQYSDDYCDSCVGAIALVLNLIEFQKHLKATKEAGVLFA
jgi:hypothetical protein